MGSASRHGGRGTGLFARTSSGRGIRAVAKWQSAKIAPAKPRSACSCSWPRIPGDESACRPQSALASGQLLVRRVPGPTKIHFSGKGIIRPRDRWGVAVSASQNPFFVDRFLIVDVLFGAEDVLGWPADRNARGQRLESEPPFLVAQLVCMALFVVLAIAAAIKFRDELEKLRFPRRSHDAARSLCLG